MIEWQLMMIKIEVKVKPFSCQMMKDNCWKLKLFIWVFLYNCCVFFHRDQFMVPCDSLTRPWRGYTSWKLAGTTRLFTQWQLSSWGKRPGVCFFLSEQWGLTLILHQPDAKLTLQHPVKPLTFQIWLHFEKLKTKSPTSGSAAHHLWRSKPDL